jgi:hypothetical protein
LPVPVTKWIGHCVGCVPKMQTDVQQLTEKIWMFE